MRRTSMRQSVYELLESDAIRRARAGDASAFEYLYKCHSKRVYALCLRILKHQAEAEELTQQAFLRLFREIATIRGESCLSTWLHHIVVSVVLTHLRGKLLAEVYTCGEQSADSCGRIAVEPC